MDAFISWTSADRDVKNVLVNRLREAGVDCWDSDREVNSNFAEECIAAVKQCQVFIVVVSEAAMKDTYVKNETTTAREMEKAGKLNIVVYKITDAPYTDQFEFLLNHISYVTGNLFQRQVNFGGESALDTIIRRVQTLLKKRKEGTPEKPFEVNMPQIQGAKIVPTGFFVEHSRDALLEAMDEGFSRSNVLILTEFVGFGKRSAIKKYVQLHGDFYRQAIMVHNSLGSLRNFLAAGLEFTNLNDRLFDSLEGESLLEAKLKQLEKLDPHTLLVIPDLQFDGEADTWLCEKLAALPLRIILLSQESADAYVDIFPVITVGRMKDQHLFELFFHHYKRAQAEEQEALEIPLSQFFAQIGGHTKTVELTAAALNRDLLALPDEVPNYLSLQGTDGLQLKERIHAHISAIFDVDTLSPDQITALIVAATMAVPYLSEKNYRTLLRKCGVTNYGVVTELDQYRWLDVDIPNGTVSIEPLIAQVLLTKFSDAYGIFSLCWDHLSDRFSKVFSLSVNQSVSVDVLNRLDYFCLATGLPVIAALAREFTRDLVLGQAYDPADMAKALAEFDKTYSGEGSGSEEAPKDEQEAFLHNVLSVIRTGILPMSRMIARGTEKLLLNFSDDSQRILGAPQTDFAVSFTGIEDIFGISFEEVTQMLEELRTVFRNYDALDEDSMEYVVSAECLTMLEHMYRRDFGAMRLSAISLLDYISRQPHLLENELICQLFYSGMHAYLSTFIVSQAFGSAILLCEKVLSFPNSNPFRGGVLRCYISALRSNDLYTDTLFDAYEELLGIYKNSADAFEKREDQQTERKQLLLMFARDLAMGGQFERAQARFAEACKPGIYLLPEETVEAAHRIVDAIIHSGDFMGATAFLDRFFPKEINEALYALCGGECQRKLEQFHHYQAADDVAEDAFVDTDPQKKHRSYYHAYSRKNNPIWEQKYCSVADKAMDFDFSQLTDEALKEQAKALRLRAKREAPLRLAPEAFALCSEAGARVLGYRHHHVQYMGGAAMADGKIAEILNGEGKTYTILLPAFLQSLYHRNVYVVDESAYLTRRNYHWMKGVFQLLGVPCQLAEAVEDMPPKKSGIVYTALKALICGYLQFETDADSLRRNFPLDAVIVDEIDTTLVDMAKTPYALTRYANEPKLIGWHETAWHLAEEVVFNETYYTCYGRKIRLTPAIYPLLEKTFGLSYRNIGDLTALRKVEGIVAAAIACCGYYKKGKDYFINQGMPVWEDKSRGVFSTFNPSYAYFLSLDNGLNTQRWEKQISMDTRYTNLICLRDFFTMFRFVCGTTATAVSYRNEFKELYGLEYIAVAPHSPCQRVDNPSCLFRSVEAKDQAILDLLWEKYENRQPVLLITQSVEESEKYDRLLTKQRIPHRLLNAKNAEAASNILADSGICGSVLVTNALAGRGADIKLGGDPQRKTMQELVEAGEDVSALADFLYTLPTPEQKELPLYQKYRSLLEKNKALCAADRQAVLSAGGLCVICTSFFLEMRTEQQSRGRSGRQGDVGESWVFWSLEDESAKPFFPAGMVEFYQSHLNTDDNIGSASLDRIVKISQQNIHNRQFADIRSINSKYQYLVSARELFIGRRFDLQDGTVTSRELLTDWIQSKPVQQALQQLQKGETHCDIPALERFWKLSDKLQNARGGRLVQILLDVIYSDMADQLELSEGELEEQLSELLRLLLLRNWEEYIRTVEHTVGVVEMKEQALKNYLQEEAQKLLCKTIENLFSMRRHKTVPSK